MSRRRKHQIDGHDVEIEFQAPGITLSEPEITTLPEPEIQSQQPPLVVDRGPYHPGKCPWCGGQMRVYATRKPIRYVKCVQCNWTDKESHVIEE